RVDLTFAPNGLTCSGTATNIEVFGSDSCTEIGRVTGVRAAGPLLLDMFPVPGEVDVNRSPVVSVLFSQEIDEFSVTSSTVQLIGPSGPVAAGIQLINSNRQVEVFPSFSGLEPATSYTVRMTRGIRGTNGTPLDREVTWSFTTLDYAAEVLASDPVAYWPMDEAGPTMSSLVGGPGANAEVRGDARSLGGIPTGAGSSIFFRSGVLPEGPGVMETTPAFANSVFPGSTAIATELWVQPYESRSYQFYCNVGLSVMSMEGSTETPNVWINNTLDMGAVSTPFSQWTHVVIQLTGSQAQVFRNGQLVLQAPFAAPLRSVAFGGFNVGNGVTGFIDEVALYDHALSPAEIQRHYEIGATRPNRRPE
ncbi:MAG: Ig-like domain-containing protein, partial [Planctomycetota bacterium]